MSLLDLPAEIFQQIAQYIDTVSLASLAVCCRALNEITCATLYANPRLFSESGVECFGNVLAKDPSVGDYIQSLGLFWKNNMVYSSSLDWLGPACMRLGMHLKQVDLDMSCEIIPAGPYDYTLSSVEKVALHLQSSTYCHYGRLHAWRILSTVFREAIFVTVKHAAVNATALSRGQSPQFQDFGWLPSPNVQVLRIDTCPELTEEYLMLLIRDCSNLRILQLENLELAFAG